MTLIARPATNDGQQLVALALCEAAELQQEVEALASGERIVNGSVAARRSEEALAAARLSGALFVLRAILDLDCAPASDLVQSIAAGLDPEVLGAA